MRNFNNPYFSRDIAEFWRRWHISLTTWFRDYVYIPLGGSRPEVPAHTQNPDRYKKLIIIRNTFVIFLLSGFWHGANWTFIAWGAYHAILFLPLILLGKNRKYTNQVAEGRFLPTWKETLQILVTFMLVVLGWIIFRATGILSLLHYLEGMCDASIFTIPWLMNRDFYIPLFLCIAVMLLLEWFQRNKQHGLDFSKCNKKSFHLFRILLYVIFTFLVEYYFCLSLEHPIAFIYFQF